MNRPFDEEKYQSLLDGLEISEVGFSELEFSFRFDSEYYQKEFVAYRKDVLSQRNEFLGKISEFITGPFGSAFKVENYEDEETTETEIDDSQYRYIRGKDVKPFVLQDNDNKYIPKSDYERLEKYAVQPNDILVSVVGTLGNASIAQERDLPAIFSCKSTILRNTTTNPYYLLTYLNSKQGKQLLLSKTRGAVQTGLNLDDLKTLVVPIFSPKFQTEIEKLVMLSQKCVEDSKQFYQEAEDELLKEIGLYNFEFSEENFDEKNFSESFWLTGRLDAEYFQPKYNELTKALLSKPYQRLSGDFGIATIIKSIETGSNAYANQGLPYIRVADLTKFGISETKVFLSDAYCEENKETLDDLKVKKDAVLLTKDGTVGIAYKVERDIEAVTSGAILHLHIRDTKEILPDFLTLVLNSEITQLQAERDAGGSIIVHWRISEIENVIIPILPIPFQERIVEMVQNSFELRNESEKLIEIAKRAVETAIEQTEDAAMDFINAELKKL